MILAEATPSPTTLWLALNSIMAFAAAMATVGLYLNSRKRQQAELYPQPLRVEATEKFVGQKEFQAHVDWNLREHENLFRKIGGVERAHVERMDQKFSELQRTTEAGREKLHERINEILGEVRELKGELKKL
jgi:hypothetical protein